MGIYLNPGNNRFKRNINSEIYVDKTKLIEYTNSVINTSQSYICISRPRRFGKTITANMLSSYYDKSVDSHELFKNYKISKSKSYKEHLNKYNVINLNIQSFLSSVENKNEVLNYLQKKVLNELENKFTFLKEEEINILSEAFDIIYSKEQEQFIFIIDEWDAILRENRNNKELQNKYLDFLRNLFKDKSYVGLVYMTGILPIKKYGTHSALNMFDEYSMIRMRELSSYTGFTEEEVKELCKKYDMNFDEMKKWYDGYVLNDYHIYNPKSVVDSLRSKIFDSYWTSTETYEALKIYINLNYDGLKEKIVKLVSGEKIKIKTISFQNDMTTFNNSDDVLTLLVHLGYLGYDTTSEEVFIPNEEIRKEFEVVIDSKEYGSIIDAINSSEKLLNNTLNGNSDYVSEKLDEIHMDNTSILKYNDENSLACIITIAYYSARNYYDIYRELPTGYGYADIVFIPKKKIDKSALVVELKYDSNAVAALDQIKNKKYTNSLKSYKGDIILVGINYDKNSKKHSCIIEKIKK